MLCKAYNKVVKYVFPVLLLPNNIVSGRTSKKASVIGPKFLSFKENSLSGFKWVMAVMGHRVGLRGFMHVSQIL